MVVDLDTTTENIDQGFPFEIFREITQVLPLSTQSLLAVSILLLLELASGIVSREWSIMNPRLSEEAYASRNAHWVSILVPE